MALGLHQCCVLFSDAIYTGKRKRKVRDRTGQVVMVRDGESETPMYASLFEEYVRELRLGWEVLETFTFNPTNPRDLAGAVLYDAEQATALVVFKGTTFRSVAEIFTDGDAVVSKHHSSDGQRVLEVHNGVAGRLRRVLVGAAAGRSLEEAVLTRLQQTDGLRRVVYTGHSLGGGMGQVCHAFHRGSLDASFASVTFGSPLVFSGGMDADFLTQLGHESTHYIHGEDVVPRVLRWGANPRITPGDIASTLCPRWVRVLLQRVNRGASALAYLEEVGEHVLMVGKPYVGNGTHLLHGGDQRALLELPSSFASGMQDHKMHNYVDCVFRYGGSGEKNAHGP